MSEDQTMIERVARACWQTQTIRAWEDAHETEREEMIGYARAAIEAMKDVPLDVLGAMYEAMFEDRWDCTQAPMVGAGWDAAIDAILNEKT